MCTYICIRIGKKRKKSKVVVPQESTQLCAPDDDVEESMLSKYHVFISKVYRKRGKIHWAKLL